MAPNLYDFDKYLTKNAINNVLQIKAYFYSKKPTSKQNRVFFMKEIQSNTNMNRK